MSNSLDPDQYNRYLGNARIQMGALAWGPGRGSRHPLKTTSGIIYKEKSYWARHPWKKFDGSDLDLSVDERVGSDVLSLVRPTWV